MRESRQSAKEPLTRLERAQRAIVRTKRAGRKVPPDALKKIDFERDLTPAERARGKSLEPYARECLARRRKAIA
jgi:hypothetical protein